MRTPHTIRPTAVRVLFSWLFLLAFTTGAFACPSFDLGLDDAGCRDSTVAMAQAEAAARIEGHLPADEHSNAPDDCCRHLCLSQVLAGPVLIALPAPNPNRSRFVAPAEHELHSLRSAPGARPPRAQT